MNRKTIKLAGILAAALPTALHAEKAVEKATELDQTVVSGTAGTMAHEIKIEPSSTSKLQVSIEDLPRSVDIISTEKFSERGSLNLQDTLNYTSGVFAGVFGIDTRVDTNAIRGIRPQQFQDGFLAFEGFYNAPRVEVFTLENVEVIKGPASALYGQGALGGIINANSKLPREDASGEFGIQVGEDNRVQTTFDSTGSANEDGSLLYRFVALQRESDTEVDNVSDDALVLMPSLTWQASEDTKLTLLAKHQKNETGSTLQFISNLDPTPGAGAGTFGTDTLPALSSLPIDSKTFVGEPDFDKYETDSNSVSAIIEHQLNDQFAIANNTRYWESDSVYQYTQAIGYSVAPPGLRLVPLTLPPAFGALFPSLVSKLNALPVLDTEGDTYRLGYKSDKELKILSNNLVFKANGNWLGLEHNAQFGVDYIKADTKDDRARDRDLEALLAAQGALAATGNPLDGFTLNTNNGMLEPNTSLAGYFLSDSKINLLNPQYAGAAPVPTETEYRNYTNEQSGVYLGDVIKVGNVIASLNLRYDTVKQSYDRRGIYSDGRDSTSYSNTYDDFNSDAAVMYQFDNGISPYYSYAESFTPNDADLSGNPVDPNEGNQHEIGVKYLSTDSDTLVTAAFFKIDEENRVTSNDPANFRVIDAKYEGAELSVQHQMEDVHVQSSYTYLDTEAVETGAAKLEVPYVPDQMANAWVSYIPSGGILNGFRAGIGARYVGTTKSDTNASETAGYTLYDAMLGYRYSDFDVQLNVSNLTNKDYIVAVSESEFGSTSYSGPARYTSITAKYLF